MQIYKSLQRQTVTTCRCPQQNRCVFSNRRNSRQDEILFRKILSDGKHLLAPLLPSEVCTPYHLRPRRHNRQLIPKVNKLCDNNFIQRMLYKDS